MTNKNEIQGLTDQIEKLVRAHITAVSVDAAAAVQRAFAAVDTELEKTVKKPRTARPGRHRSKEEMEALGKRFYQELCQTPGAGIKALAAKVGVTSQELYRPVNNLKQAGRVRSIGQRQFTQYFPLAAAVPTIA